MIEALKEKFGHLGLTYSIGGQISFDVFPTGQSLPFDYLALLAATSTYTSSPAGIWDMKLTCGVGWDKTFSLNHIQDEGFTEIHFFGDKVSPSPTYKSRLPVPGTWVLVRNLRVLC